MLLFFRDIRLRACAPVHSPMYESSNFLHAYESGVTIVQVLRLQWSDHWVRTVAKSLK